MNDKSLLGILEKSNVYPKSKEEFLETVSPWHTPKGEELIKCFISEIKGEENKFVSWLNILSECTLTTIKQKKDDPSLINVRYQIPEHVQGDIDNAVLFHCMENPRGFIDDKKVKEWAKNEENNISVKSYYEHVRENHRGKDIKTFEDLIVFFKECYLLKDLEQIENLKYEQIKDIIYSEKSALEKELEKEIDENKKYDILVPRNNKNVLSHDYYYLANYYYQLVSKKDVFLEKFNLGENLDECKSLSKKICNLEVYPFSSSDPQLGKDGFGNKIIESEDDISCLGAHIILRRIYIYLKNRNKKPKPIFVFRKYDRAWKIVIVKVLEKIVGQENKKDCEECLKYLENEFFYCQWQKQGGGITSGNISTVSAYQAINNLIARNKKDTFNEIKNLLKS